MEMQDKEFDSIFSSKLNDFEVEPSKAVWQGINDGLGNNNRKKVLPFLGIAASIIVVIAAGIVFLTQKATVVKPRVKNRVAVNQPSKVAPAVTAVKPQAIIVQQPVIAANTVTEPKHVVKSNKVNVPVKHDIAIQHPTVTQPQQQVLASTVVTKNDIVQPKGIDSANMVASVPTVHPQPDKPAVIAATTVPIEKPADTPPIKKRRIHTFGDMLNVVIAAVDKRKDKVIEFSNTDGDESTITGVNLGVIKIKKEN